MIALVARPLVALLITLFVLVNAAPATQAAGARMAAGDLIASSVILWGTDCPADEDAASDDPKVVAKLAAGACTVRWNGSGTVIDSSGLILTNAHIVLDDIDDPEAKPVWLAVGVTDDPRELPSFTYFARTIAFDQRLDLALVRIAYAADGEALDPEDMDLPAVELAAVDPEDMDLPAIELAKDTADLTLEDTVRLIGYPGVGGPSVTVIYAQVAGFSPDLDPENENLGDAAFVKIGPAGGAGISGGTAVNEAGQLIGVPTLAPGTELRCVDLDHDGASDPTDLTTECFAMPGEIAMVRAIEIVHDFLDKVLPEDLGRIPHPDPKQ